MAGDCCAPLGLCTFFVCDPRAALVPRLPWAGLLTGLWPSAARGRDGTPVEMKRLPPAKERVVLGEMERQLEQRALCLRQADKLVFPSH